MSHELKTPLTSMKVLADSLLTQEEVPNELYKEFMGDIAEEIERENKIITDLLSLVKMDKKAASLNIETMDINDLLELILKRLRPIAAKKNIEVVLESFRPVTAEVDESRPDTGLYEPGGERHQIQQGKRLGACVSGRGPQVLLCEGHGFRHGYSRRNPWTTSSSAFTGWTSPIPVRSDGTGLGLAIAKSASAGTQGRDQGVQQAGRGNHLLRADSADIILPETGACR